MEICVSPFTQELNLGHLVFPPLVFLYNHSLWSRLDSEGAKVTQWASLTKDELKLDLLPVIQLSEDYITLVLLLFSFVINVIILNYK